MEIKETKTKDLYVFELDFGAEYPVVFMVIICPLGIRGDLNEIYQGKC